MHDDLKAAVRSLNASKTFTVVALIVLTLGIGASTAIFSVVDAVVLRGTAVRRARPPRRRRRAAAAVRQGHRPDARSRRALERGAPELPGLEGAAAGLRVDGRDRGELVHAPGAWRGTRGPPRAARHRRISSRSSASSRPSAGRSPTRTRWTGVIGVAVLSDGLWRRRFGGDPTMVGRTIPLEGGAYEVIGIMPPGFQYPVGAARATDLWLPYVVPTDERIRDPHSRSIYLSDDCAAEARRHRRAGPGADGPDRRAHPAGAIRSGTRTT